MILIKLFFAFLKIGAFSFGGGYSMIPFIEKEIIEKNQWITTKNFIDMLAISQMTPGPIAINSATFVGYTIHSFYGSIIATLGVILPSLMMVSIISKYLFQFKDKKIVSKAFLGIRPAVLALIITATLSIAKSSFVDAKSISIGGLMFFLLYKYNLHPILIILISSFLGIILY